MGIHSTFYFDAIVNGFFSGIEMAYYSANRLSLELKKNRETLPPASLQDLLSRPTGFWAPHLLDISYFLLFWVCN
jgi:CBS domain containing-hemolysin-like protein